MKRKAPHPDGRNQSMMAQSPQLQQGEQQHERQKQLQERQQQQQQQSEEPLPSPGPARKRRRPNGPASVAKSQARLAQTLPSPSSTDLVPPSPSSKRDEELRAAPSSHGAPTPLSAAPETNDASARHPAEPRSSAQPSPSPSLELEPGPQGPPSTSQSPEPGIGIKTKPILSRERLVNLTEKAERRGVVYISRIPPHMKPAKIRHLLSAHGEIGRVYCAPEDIAVRRERKRRNGGKDTGKSFTEGWVEFEDKRVAKNVAARLNGQPIGGKKRSAYYYDLWCLKYLPKFKWDNLTEEINYQRAVREQRLAAEISSAKRERDFYLSRVDRAKAVTAIQERKKALGQAEVDGQAAAKASASASASAKGEGSAEGEARQSFVRPVRQKIAKAEGLEAGAGALPDDVLALIGARKTKS